ncbi:isoaspartyl peptidase/L-asparaginase [Temperatibacter marinus]|uniref:Isoaspartyl peptidase n=1 Tax=Temperatibacter marinus TaxID=1456591 RepID=A0AA52H8E0_9PROT|nr:isoaspartyl peptidase/L-asparaginase [Temperatibacter marinus]WND02031.1 isoaspartyl peptidase/L-asparaginase [Temperatibacter marinus]
MFKKLITMTAVALIVSTPCLTAEVLDIKAEAKEKRYSLVIHGGAGTILKKHITPEIEKRIRGKLTKSLLAGETILKSGGSSLDAIVASIKILEDSPEFNAGHGAVFTSEGKNELDASIMDGRTLNAGSIAGVTTIKNPITLARAVMDKSRHVMFIGNGAETFAREQGIETVDPSYFYVERRYQQLLRAQGRDKSSAYFSDHRFGTVGAVAIDQEGNIAAGTSTGGMTNKRYGRVGDVPIIGAGTYANNKSCGVSATGHGEYFIRATVARSICALMEYKGLSLQEAADAIVMEQLVEMKGDGGIIAVDKDGNIVYSFNSAGMYRGKVSQSEKPSTGIFKDN